MLLRNLAFMLTALLLLLVQTNFFRALQVLGPWTQGMTPSLTLPLIVYLGVHEPSVVRGSLLAAAIGYLVDVMGGAPIRLFTVVSLLLWGLARLVGVRLSVQTWIMRVALGFGFCIVESAIILGVLALFGQDARRPVEMSAVVLPHALATAVCAPLVFRVAQRLQQGIVPVNAPGGAGR